MLVIAYICLVVIAATLLFSFSCFCWTPLSILLHALCPYYIYTMMHHGIIVDRMVGTTSTSKMEEFSSYGFTQGQQKINPVVGQITCCFVCLGLVWYRLQEFFMALWQSVKRVRRGGMPLALRLCLVETQIFFAK